MKQGQRIRIRVELIQEGSVVVARAKELGVSTSGKSDSAAMEAMKEALQLFLETLEEMGTWEQVLTESGYVRQGTEWALPDCPEGWTAENIVPLEVIEQIACVEI